jgi:hypothetical protein
VSKVRLFLLYDIRTKLLFLEAFIFLGWARSLKNKPFSKVAPILGEHMKESTIYENDAHKKTLKNVSMAINIMSKYTFWESMCLVKAIAAMKMLERRNIESTIYLGTAKDEKGKLIAHAWLRSGPFYLTGAEVKDRFIVVSKFTNTIDDR